MRYLHDKVKADVLDLLDIQSWRLRAFSASQAHSQAYIQVKASWVGVVAVLSSVERIRNARRFQSLVDINTSTTTQAKSTHAETAHKAS